MCQGRQCISGSSAEYVRRVYKEKTELSHHHLRKKLQKPRLLRIHLNKHHQMEVRSLCPTGVRAQANHLHSRTSVWSSYQEFSIPVHLSTALARAKKLAKSIEIRAKSFLRKSVSACGSCERCANQKFVWWLCHQTHQSAQGPEIECKKNQEENEPELLCRYSLRSDRENAIADLCARLLRKALKEDTIPLDSREKGVVV